MTYDRPAVMRGVKSRDTGPEWVVRAMLCAIASTTSAMGMLGLQTSDVPRDEKRYGRHAPSRSLTPIEGVLKWKGSNLDGSVEARS